MEKKKKMESEFKFILPPHCKQMVQSWLQEDIPGFDCAAIVVGDKTETAVLLCKSAGVLCGRPFFDLIFSELGCTVEWAVEEGAVLSPEPVEEVAWVTGPANKLLQGERTALNLLTRASGIASYARELREEVKKLGWKGEVAGTRKTTPGFRMVDMPSLLVESRHTATISLKW